MSLTSANMRRGMFDQGTAGDDRHRGAQRRMAQGGGIGENDGMSNKKTGKDKPNGGGTIALNKRAPRIPPREKFEAGLACRAGS